jgi:uncharacterized membrane protein YfcA
MALVLTTDTIIFFALLSFFAAIVNGGLGYGYSSISIPLAILVLASRIVNPAYVILELILNVAILGFVGRKKIKATYRRCLPVIVTLVPGVVIGTLILSSVAPTEVKFIAYVALLPLIILQVGGFRRSIRSEVKAGAPLGFGTGLLYSLTTISGPPIALFWNNQGLPKDEFKAAIAQIRVAESSFTVVAYYLAGIFNATTTLPVFGLIAPTALLGIPIGMLMVRRLSVETFRRLAMNLSAIIIGYGLSQTLISLFKVPVYEAYAFWALVLALDLYLFFRYMRIRKRVPVEKKKEEEGSTFPALKTAS